MSRPIAWALLGDPVGHSLSPAIHRAALAHLGIAGRYTARRADMGGLEQAFAEMRAGQLDGANVTMPLKGAAAELADRLTPEAARAGSVNTLRQHDGMVQGHSTDVVAARETLADSRFPDGAPVLILGSGGAAAAVAVAAEGRLVHVAARRAEAAGRVLALAPVPGSVVPFPGGVEGALVVNATPIGMGGETLPEEVLRRAVGLIDLAYAAGGTASTAWAARNRLPSLDGIEFLVMQAAASFQWWTGRPAPVPVMLEAARNA